MKLIISSLLLGLVLAGCSEPCYPAESRPDWNRLANAIYKAEGGSRTAHPYGILAHYRHTTPRQACINTCKTKYRQWASNSKAQSYLEYLASKYAPIGVSNDIKGLNRNWLKNVSYFYSR